MQPRIQHPPSLFFFTFSIFLLGGVAQIKGHDPHQVFVTKGTEARSANNMCLMELGGFSNGTPVTTISKHAVKKGRREKRCGRIGERARLISNSSLETPPFYEILCARPYPYKGMHDLVYG